jgi:hypothetical protein
VCDGGWARRGDVCPLPGPADGGGVRAGVGGVLRSPPAHAPGMPHAAHGHGVAAPLGDRCSRAGGPPGSGRRRRGVGPAVPPVRELILRRVRLLTGRGAPAPHHRFPEQLIHAHRGRTAITTAATARTTVVTVRATITDRPLHNTGRIGVCAHGPAVIISPRPEPGNPEQVPEGLPAIAGMHALPKRRSAW